tara:strand:+ start:289 stop:486 length:198 start_codon:yes stop_codon:yes gene_type:complete
MIESLKQAVVEETTDFYLYFNGAGDPEKGEWVTYEDNMDDRIGPKSKELVSIDFILDIIHKSGFE